MLNTNQVHHGVMLYTFPYKYTPENNALICQNKEHYRSLK